MSESGRASPLPPLSPIGITLPTLAAQRHAAQPLSPTQSSTRRSGGSRRGSRRGSRSGSAGGMYNDAIQGGNQHMQVLPFNNHFGAHHLLPGPNGGGAVGLPNYLPLGHPSLSASASMNARAQHGSNELEMLLGGGGSASSAGIGLEGWPYVSAAERNRAESRTVSEATMLFASLARDAAQHGTPRTMEKHNTTLAQLRVFAAGGPGGAIAIGKGANAAQGPHVPRNMPTFEVEHFMRTNQRMLTEQDRFSAADVLRVEPYDRTPAQIHTLAKFLSSVSFFAPLSDALRENIAGLATLRTLRKDEAVYSEGDESVHLFVVLSGSVGTRVRDFTSHASSSQKLGRDARERERAAAAAASSTSGGFVAVTASVGELFGAETLGGDERTVARSQTKLALEPRTELLCVDMREYKALMKSALTKESQDRMAFVASLPLFENCSLREIHRVATALQPLSLQKNSLVFKQGDMAEKVYFILSGEVRVVTKVYTKVTVAEKAAYKAVPLQGRQASREAAERRRARTASRASGGMDGMSGDEFDYASGGDSDSGLQHERSRSFAAAASSTGAIAATAASHGRSASLAGGHARTSSQLSRSSGGGGGAYKLERARAFQAGRNGGEGGGSMMRPDFGATSSSSLFGSPLSPSGGHSRSQSLQPAYRVELRPQLLDLGRLGAKWFFGERGVLKDEPRSASVYAETNVQLLVLGKEDFFSRLPPFCLKYLEDYAQHFYADPQQMKEQYRAQQRWDEFKLKMLHKSRRTQSVSEGAQAFSGTLNALKH